MRFRVEVDVATCRPPKVDSTAVVVLDSDSHIDAEWTAIAMVCCHPHVEMPVGSRVKRIA